jgi:protein-disulfide isomerase
LIAAVVVRREFFTKPASASANAPPEQLADWPDISKAGRLMGRFDAPLTIVEFSDLECPFCRKFHEGSLRVARARFGDSLALRYVHFTIPGHRFAEPAAIATECAGEQSRFGEMLDAIYAHQDSLGLRSWSSYAIAAGVADTSAFRECVGGRRGLDAIQAGKTLGERVRVVGTPTLVINGWKLTASQDTSEFLQLLERIVKTGRP